MNTKQTHKIEGNKHGIPNQTKTINKTIQIQSTYLLKQYKNVFSFNSPCRLHTTMQKTMHKLQYAVMYRMLPTWHSNQQHHRCNLNEILFVWRQWRRRRRSTYSSCLRLVIMSLCNQNNEKRNLFQWNLFDFMHNAHTKKSTAYLQGIVFVFHFKTQRIYSHHSYINATFPHIRIPSYWQNIVWF